MREYADVERAIGAGHIGFTDAGPVGPILTGRTDKSRAMALQLQPAGPIRVTVERRPLIDAAVAVGIPLERIAVRRRRAQYEVACRLARLRNILAHHEPGAAHPVGSRVGVLEFHDD